MYLDPLPASRVAQYALAALEQEARDLARSIDLFLLPGEAFAGGGAILKSLTGSAKQLSGANEPGRRGPTDPLAELERQYLDDIEAALEAGDNELADHLERDYRSKVEELSAETLKDVRERSATEVVGDVRELRAIQNWFTSRA